MYLITGVAFVSLRSSLVNVFLSLTPNRCLYPCLLCTQLPFSAWSWGLPSREGLPAAAGRSPGVAGRPCSPPRPQGFVATQAGPDAGSGCAAGPGGVSLSSKGSNLQGEGSLLPALWSEIVGDVALFPCFCLPHRLSVAVQEGVSPNHGARLSLSVSECRASCRCC